MSQRESKRREAGHPSESTRPRGSAKRLAKENDTPARSGGWEDVPAEVRQAFDRGWWVVPRLLDTRNGKWHPPFKWRKYRKQRPTQEDIIRWNQKYPDALWAGVTGLDFIVTEFDVLDTLERTGLKPHIISPGGSGHAYVHAPDFLVQGGSRIDPARFPGMDLLAYGQLATFFGTRPDGKYRRPKGAPRTFYTLDDLPDDLRELIKSRKFTKADLRPPALPLGFTDVMPSHELLGEALRRSTLEGRNAMGFWLAVQLRDERRSFAEVRAVVERQYQPLVSSSGTHPYTPQEAYDSVVSAFSRPARLPRRLGQGEGAILMSKIAIARVHWLWKPWIPAAKISLLEGNSGRGKSNLSVDIAARITSGTPMPGETEKQEPGAVLFICNEDDAADTILPRLIASGAVLGRVAVLPPRRDPKTKRLSPLEIPEDLTYIEDEIRTLASDARTPVKLVVIDPITGYLSEKINYGNDPHVRRALIPLAESAQELRVAFLLVRHLNKNTSQSAEHRGGGSVAFGAASRSQFVVEWHPEHPSVGVMAMLITNLTQKPRSLTYRIISTTVEHDIEATRIQWGEPIDLPAEALLRGPDARRKAPERDAARDWLGPMLSDGPMDSKELQREANAAGHAWGTVKAAAREMGVEHTRIRDKKTGTTERWVWALPAMSPEIVADVSSK